MDGNAGGQCSDSIFHFVRLVLAVSFSALSLLHLEPLLRCLPEAQVGNASAEGAFFSVRSCTDV